MAYGKEIDHIEYVKLTAAVAASVASANPAPLGAYAKDLLKDVIKSFGQSVVFKALKNRGTTFGAGNFYVQAGIATYNHWEIVDAGSIYNPFTRKRVRITKKIPLPNTHQLYIRWKRR